MQNETTLKSLPVRLELDMKIIFPPSAPSKSVVDEPRIVHLVIVLYVASVRNLIVLVRFADDVLVFEIVSELPPEFNPSIIT